MSLPSGNGQTIAASSVSVVMASDAPSVDIDVTGLATETTLAVLENKIVSCDTDNIAGAGQALSAASVSVVWASDALVQPVAEDNVNGVIAMAQKLLSNGAYSPDAHAGFGTVTKVNVKATPAIVVQIIATNANAAVRYFQLHDKASAPAAAEVPALSVPVAALGGSQVISLAAMGGMKFATGLGWAWSTTAATFTDSATAADHTNHVFYK